MKLLQIDGDLFRTVGERPRPLLYAFMEEPTLSPVMQASWYRCGQDGEPSHPVRFNETLEITWEK